MSACMVLTLLFCLFYRFIILLIIILINLFNAALQKWLIGNNRKKNPLNNQKLNSNDWYRHLLFVCSVFLFSLFYLCRYGFQYHHLIIIDCKSADAVFLVIFIKLITITLMTWLRIHQHNHCCVRFDQFNHPSLHIYVDVNMFFGSFFFFLPYHL